MRYECGQLSTAQQTQFEAYVVHGTLHFKASNAGYWNLSLEILAALWPKCVAIAAPLFLRVNAASSSLARQLKDRAVALNGS